MKEYRIAFWTPGNMPIEDGQTFGCAAHGFCDASTWVNPDEKACMIWEHQVKGEVLSGTYHAVLSKVKELTFMPKVAIAVFTRPQGMEAFLASLIEILPELRMVGGGAAVGAGQCSGEVMPKAEEVAILLPVEDNLLCISKNIHQQTGTWCHVKALTDRSFQKIKLQNIGEYENAVDFYKKEQKNRGIDENDFESMTFCDALGRNIHCSIADGIISTGANLPADGILQLVATSTNSAREEMLAFFSQKNAFIFGCAGLRSLLREQIVTQEGSVAGFMFGEIVMPKNQAVFGNLMMAALIQKPSE